MLSSFLESFETSFLLSYFRQQFIIHVWAEVLSIVVSCHNLDSVQSVGEDQIQSACCYLLSSSANSCQISYCLGHIS